MQTKHLKYLFSALTAIYFLLAGTGYNIVQYCCDDCEKEGIEFVMQHSCAVVHHELHHDCNDMHDVIPLESDSIQLLKTCTHTNSCKIIRIQLDDFSVVGQIVDTHTSFNDLFVEINADIAMTGYSLFAYVLHEYSPPLHLFAQSGREILNNKSVLVI